MSSAETKNGTVAEARYREKLGAHSPSSTETFFEHIVEQHVRRVPSSRSAGDPRNALDIKVKRFRNFLRSAHAHVLIF